MGERQQVAEPVAHRERMAALRALGRSHERLRAAHIATYRAHVTALLRVRSSAPPIRTGDRGSSGYLLDTVNDDDGVPDSYEPSDEVPPEGGVYSTVVVRECARWLIAENRESLPEGSDSP